MPPTPPRPPWFLNLLIFRIIVLTLQHLVFLNQLGYEAAQEGRP